MWFSWRKGYKSPRTAVQRESVDEQLRNRLWNCLCQCYWERRNEDARSYFDPMAELLRRMWHQFFKRPVDTLPESWRHTYAELRGWFYASTWDEVYSFVEFVPGAYPVADRNSWFRQTCNEVLREELSAYRFVNELITEVTAEEEMAAVEQALDATRRMPPVQAHLKKAQEHLADRDNPDYRNSMEESISAVEALLTQLTGKRGFAAALQALEVPLRLHRAQKGAFEKLYGYTSDAQGIRHALADEAQPSFEDAKYMWVVCSAFVNFITARVAAARLSQSR